MTKSYKNILLKSHRLGFLILYTMGLGFFFGGGRGSNLNDDDYSGLVSFICLRLGYGEKHGIPQIFSAA